MNSVLDRKDTLALLPTGGGKSICFQVPAMQMKGLCLVISPLIALIKDQVENLKRKGIAAIAVHSGMEHREVLDTYREALKGETSFLYLSPERLQTGLFLEYLPGMNVKLIAVDESHCISQWGYDFRPAYLNISKLREHLPDVPVIALTASATLEVQKDICEKLKFGKDHYVFQQSFERPNLSYSVFRPVSKQTRLLEILQKVDGSGIVYCKSRKQTQQVADLLKMHGINAEFYNAGLNADIRNERQEKWLNNEIRIMVCTNAFGMGIDKPDVRIVVHYDVPDCLENYYQEAGRAGRDGNRSYAVLLYAANEIDNLFEQVEQRFPDAGRLKSTYINLMNYLQVAAGTGEAQAFTFDIGIFCSQYNENIRQATYTLQALAKDGLFSYNEMVFTPSKVEFTVSKESLNDFIKTNPELDPVIKGLLRSYEGIFDYPTTVYESQLGWFLKKPVTVVKKELLMLHAYGIINYAALSEKPQVFLLKNRMYADDFKFKLQAHLDRKEYYRKRIKAVSDFISEPGECRSKMLASYFNDHSVKDCGICDNCLNKKKQPATETDIKKIADNILSRISGNVNIKELQKHFQNNSLFWTAINFMVEENLILSTDDGYIRRNERVVK